MSVNNLPRVVRSLAMAGIDLETFWSQVRRSKVPLRYTTYTTLLSSVHVLWIMLRFRWVDISSAPRRRRTSVA